jgi:hypothetical protein
VINEWTLAVGQLTHVGIQYRPSTPARGTSVKNQANIDYLSLTSKFVNSDGSSICGQRYKIKILDVHAAIVRG